MKVTKLWLFNKHNYEISSDAKFCLFGINDGTRYVFMKFDSAMDAQYHFNDIIAYPGVYQWDDEDDIMDSWNNLEEYACALFADFKAGMLSAPTYDINNPSKTAKEPDCVCSDRDIMIHGCPSARGLKCRSK